MPHQRLLEVCAFTVPSCILAEQSGAARIELCRDYAAGGLTPLYDTIQLAIESTSIPIYPIIRPRGGDFFYSYEEFDEIKKNIITCKQLQCPGIVTGISLQNGEIDTQRLKELVVLAHPMKVTCHRVFDRTPDPYKALEDIITTGCERILTSGQAPVAVDATALIAALVKQAGDRIIIMPGSGVRASNIAQLIQETGANEFHSSARVPETGELDRQELQQMLDILKLP